MSVAHIAGRFIKFTIAAESGSFVYEFEIISGSVSDVAQHDLYLPVGRQIMNVVPHGRTVTYTFTGVLLANYLPWNEFDPNDNSDGEYPVYTTTGLTPQQQVSNIRVVLNRGGTTTSDFDVLDEVFHYSQYGYVVSMDHQFDTGNHQVFTVTIVADGSYETPQLIYTE